MRIDSQYKLSWRELLYSSLLPTIATLTMIIVRLAEEGPPSRYTLISAILIFGITLCGMLYFPLACLGMAKSAVFHATLALLSQACVLIMMAFALLEIRSGFVFFIGTLSLTSSLMLLFSSLIAVPVALIPLLRRKHGPRHQQTVVKAHLVAEVKFFKTLFAELKRAIEEERSPKKLLSALQNQLEENATAKIILQRELQETRDEVEQYRKMIQLTERQREALLAQKSKKNEYWMGLVIGIISSGIVASIGWLLSNYFN